MKRTGTPLPTERDYTRPRIEETFTQIQQDPHTLPVELFFSFFENYDLTQSDYHSAFLVSKNWSIALTAIMQSKKGHFKAKIFSLEVARVQIVIARLLNAPGQQSPNRQIIPVDLQTLLTEAEQMTENQTQVKLEKQLYCLLTTALTFHLYTKGASLDSLLDLCRFQILPACFLRDTHLPRMIESLCQQLMSGGRIENAFALLEIYQKHLAHFHQKFAPMNVKKPFIPLLTSSMIFEPLGWQRSLEVTCNISMIELRHWALEELIKFSHQHLQSLQPEEQIQEIQEWMTALGTRLIQMRDLEGNQYPVKLERIFVSMGYTLIQERKTSDEQTTAKLKDYLVQHFPRWKKLHSNNSKNGH